jgi:hypothetical protein
MSHSGIYPLPYPSMLHPGMTWITLKRDRWKPVLVIVDFSQLSIFVTRPCAPCTFAPLATPHHNKRARFSRWIGRLNGLS